MREIEVTAREAVMFCRELEYQCLEMCPLCYKRRRRIEAIHYKGTLQNDIISNRTTTGVSVANEAITNEDRSTLIHNTHVGWLIHCTLGRRWWIGEPNDKKCGCTR